jgi:catechol 2,3-dioxygenase-like lactoylglutathione lyase family enzyme
VVSVASVTIDHLGLPASNPEGSARWFAELLGLPAPEPDGPDADMFNVHLSDDSSLLFVADASHASYHLAFGVTLDDFHATVGRLRERGLSFGNDPEAPDNGATDDPLGGQGRVYFRTPDGHFLELTVRATPFPR